MSTLREGVWLFPCFGRAEGVRRLARSVERCDPDARVVALLSSGDPDLVEVIKALPDTWRYEVFPAETYVGDALNLGVAMYSEEAFYGFLANDVEVVAEGTLARLAQECPRFGLSYCDDGLQGINLPTHPCVSGDLVRAVGWFAYPGMKHNGLEVYLRELALEGGGVAYVCGAKMQHYHPIAKTAKIDEVYLRALAVRSIDDLASDRWYAGGRDTAVRMLREVMQ